MPDQINDQKLINNLCRAIMDGGNWVRLFLMMDELQNHPNKTNLVNRKTAAGYTAIYYAIKKGNYKLIEQLISLGADLHATYDGFSLRDLVQQEIIKGNDPQLYMAIDQLLEKHHVKMNETESKRTRLNQLNGQDKEYTQHELTDLFVKNNYQKISKGYCNGVAWMGAQAFLLEDRDNENNLVHLENYARRMNYIRENQDKQLARQIDFSEHKRILLVEAAKIKIKEEKVPASQQQKYIDDYVEKSLDAHEKTNLEISPLLNGIELFQQVYQHNELLKLLTL